MIIKTVGPYFLLVRLQAIKNMRIIEFVLRLDFSLLFL